jgi:creatinine amidohydrolase/Fe(II)-dependent formamide hydrolase-like protein
MNHILPTATTSDEKERDAECAVLPVGSFEQHGDYLPLITDTVIASVISRELAGAYPLLQLPPVTISCSHEHSAWRGTVSISSSTLHSVIDDIYHSITDAGRAISRSLSVTAVTLGSHELESPHPVAADPFCGFLDGVHVLEAE